MEANGRQAERIQEWIDNLLENASDIMKQYYDSMYYLSVRTKYDRINLATKFLNDVGKKEEELDYNDFYNYISNVKKIYENEEIKKTSHVTRYLTLKPFCKFLYKQGIISENYMEDIPKPKYIESRDTIEKRNNGYLTIDEIKMVMDKINQDKTYRGVRDRALFSFMLNTGIRESALLDINVQDYDRIKRCVTVTEKEDVVREYCISSDVCKLIDKWIDVRNKCEFMYTDQLFLALHAPTRYDQWGKNRIVRYHREQNRDSWSYKEMKTTDLYAIVRGRTACIKGKKISPHKLRATYGTQIYEKTKDIYFTQKCMGHKSPVTTEKYIRSNVNPTIQASDIMTDIMK